MEKQIKKKFNALRKVSYSYFREKGWQVGPYTSPNPVKRSIFYRRLLNLLTIFPCDLDEDAMIVDFGAGQCIFSIFLLSLGYNQVKSVDINEKSLQEGVSLLDYYNDVLKTSFRLDTCTEMPKCEIDLICAIDVFEHFTPQQAIGIIRSTSSPKYLLNIPSENFLYSLGTGFRREKDHHMRPSEVLAIFNQCGFDIRSSRTFLSLFNGYLLERGS